MEVTIMSNTIKKTNHPAKDGTVNPNAISEKTIKISEVPAFLGEQRKQVYINRQKELDQFSEISDKVFNELVKEGSPFFAMRALNRKITDEVLIALIEELILLRNEANPIDCIRDNPLKKVWSGFFESYNGTTTKSLTNTANASQSFRNMLACFPAKSKAVMLALDEAGLENNWIIPKNNKKVSFSPEDEKEINLLLQKSGILNPSMELKDRYKVFKALGGKLTSRLVKHQLKQQLKQ